MCTVIPWRNRTSDKEEQDVVMVDGEGNNLWTRCQIAHFKGKDGGFDRKIGRMLDTHEQTMREDSTTDRERKRTV